MFVHVCLNVHVCVCTVYVKESQGAVKRRRAGNAPRHRKQANSISHSGEPQRDGLVKAETVENAGLHQ